MEFQVGKKGGRNHFCSCQKSRWSNHQFFATAAALYSLRAQFPTVAKISLQTKSQEEKLGWSALRLASLIRFPARTKNRGSLKSFPRELDKSYRRRWDQTVLTHFLLFLKKSRQIILNTVDYLFNAHFLIKAQYKVLCKIKRPFICYGVIILHFLINAH